MSDSRSIESKKREKESDLKRLQDIKTKIIWLTK